MVYGRVTLQVYLSTMRPTKHEWQPYPQCSCQESESPAHSSALTTTVETREGNRYLYLVWETGDRQTGVEGTLASPWQRLFRWVISSCRPVSMARCSCFRKAIPLSTLATCCSRLPASIAAVVTHCLCYLFSHLYRASFLQHWEKCRTDQHFAGSK